MNAKDGRNDRTLYQSAASDELTPDRIREIETRWKSDVDKKLDELMTFAKRYAAFLDMLVEREQAAAKMRAAIIEKSIVALIWGVVIGFGTLIVTGMRTEAQAFLEAMDKIRNHKP